VTFSEDTQYLIEIEQYSYTPTPKLSQTTATITAGFTKKLSVTNGTVKKWTSKNTKIAKVNSKGKITAVKKGKTTIYAILKNGTKLACKVTVKENKFSDTKITTSDVDYGSCTVNVYSMSYDSKGNLVMKASVVNNTAYQVTQLDNFKITATNPNGKTIGVYKFTKKSVSISSHSTKTLTFTIKKSALKKKTKQDLRNSTVSFNYNEAGYHYRY
jgi:SLAP domain-containing protein